MTTTANREAKLVEAAFSRDLSKKERARLEDALAGSGVLAERYRRLQLAERVAAHGPREALERPAPAEVDRVARSLGLLEPAPARARWRVLASPWLFGAALAVTAGLAVITFTPPTTQDVLLARGGEAAGASFSAYVVGPQGGFSALSPGATLEAGARLKLRLAWSGEAAPLSAVWVAAVDGAGRVVVTRLEAPRGDLGAVPGVVPLWGLSPGPITAFAIAAPEAYDEEAVRAAVEGRPEAASVSSALAAAGVERFDFELEGGGASPP